MVRNAVTVSAVDAACCTDAQKIEGMRCGSGYGYAATRQITGYARKTIRRAKPKRYVSRTASRLPARSQNTPSPTSPMQKPGLAQLQKRFTRSAASRDSTLSESSAHAVAAPTGYPPMSPSTRAGAVSGGRPYNRLSGFASSGDSRAVSQRTSSPLITKNGNKAGKACAAARESPSRTPSAQAVGQSKNAAKEPAIRTAS